MNPAAAPPSGPKSMRPFRFSRPPEFPEIAPRDPGRTDRRPDPDRIGATRRPPPIPAFPDAAPAEGSNPPPVGVVFRRSAPVRRSAPWRALPATAPARVRAARKPNSVPRTGRPEQGGGHVSTPTVARRVERPTRRLARRGLRLPIWSCSVRGLPCPGPHGPGGALLPHLFTLTAPRTERRSVFCGTFLPVTRTGDYPAHCPAEFGLSSRPPKGAGDRLNDSNRDGF